MGTPFPPKVRPGSDVGDGVVDEVEGVVADDHTAHNPTADDAAKDEDTTATWTGGFLPVSMGLSLYSDAPRLTVREFRRPDTESRRWRRRTSTARRVGRGNGCASPCRTRSSTSILLANSRSSPIWLRSICSGGHWGAVTCSPSHCATRRPPARESGPPMGGAALPMRVHRRRRRRSILEYPSPAASVPDDEADELRLRYLRARAFAAGHGCAAMWEPPPADDDVVASVRTEVMPWHEVSPVTSDIPVPTEVLDQRYCAEAPAEAVIDGMRGFIDAYENWAEVSTSTGSQANGNARPRIASANGSPMSSSACARGVDRLAGEDPVADGRLPPGQPGHVAPGVPRGGVTGRPATHTGPTRRPGCVGQQARRWYPFQLGFFLTVVDDLVDPRSDDRATVDLLWFPTGGGKIGRMAASRACHVGTPPGGRRWVPIGTGCDGHVPLECADYSGAV